LERPLKQALAFKGSDDEQSQQTMAASYANVVQTYLSRNSKPPDVQDPNDDEIDNPNTVYHDLKCSSDLSIICR
jgi:hypothetical protein